MISKEREIKINEFINKYKKSEAYEILCKYNHPASKKIINALMDTKLFDFTYNEINKKRIEWSIFTAEDLDDISRLPQRPLSQIIDIFSYLSDFEVKEYGETTRRICEEICLYECLGEKDMFKDKLNVFILAHYEYIDRYGVKYFHDFDNFINIFKHIESLDKTSDEYEGLKLKVEYIKAGLI